MSRLWGSWYAQPEESINSAMSYKRGVVLALYELVHLRCNWLLSDSTALKPLTAATDALRLEDDQADVATVAITASMSTTNTQLLKELITFSSFLFTEMKDIRSANYTKLCLLLFTCCTEHEKHTAALSDAACDVPLFIKGKVFNTLTVCMLTCLKGLVTVKQPLLYSIIDVITQLIKNNLKKKLQVDLYR